MSAKTREQQRRTETAEKRGLMKNIMTVVPVRPTRLVCHEKYLNDGLRKKEVFGDLALFNYWARNKCLQNVISTTQAGPGRLV